MKYICSYCVVFGNLLKLFDLLLCGNVYVDGDKNGDQIMILSFYQLEFFLDLFLKKFKNLGCFNLYVYVCVLIYCDNFIMYICLYKCILFLIIISIV